MNKWIVLGGMGAPDDCCRRFWLLREEFDTKESAMEFARGQYAYDWVQVLQLMWWREITRTTD